MSCYELLWCFSNIPNTLNYGEKWIQTWILVGLCQTLNGQRAQILLLLEDTMNWCWILVLQLWYPLWKHLCGKLPVNKLYVGFKTWFRFGLFSLLNLDRIYFAVTEPFLWNGWVFLCINASVVVCCVFSNRWYKLL